MSTNIFWADWLIERFYKPSPPWAVISRLLLGWSSCLLIWKEKGVWVPHNMYSTFAPILIWILLKMSKILLQANQTVWWSFQSGNKLCFRLTLQTQHYFNDVGAMSGSLHRIVPHQFLPFMPIWSNVIYMQIWHDMVSLCCFYFCFCLKEKIDLSLRLQHEIIE